MERREVVEERLAHALFVRTSIEERGVATVALASHATRNALSEQMLDELITAFDECSRTTDVRVIVLAAEGSVFCAGVDLRSAAGRMDGIVSRLVSVELAIVKNRVPVIARVQGPARAGGIGLIAACDMAFASTASDFALSEVRLGLAPAAISLTILPRMSPRAASELMLTGRRFSAEEARAHGLVTAAVAPDDLDRAVEGMVAELLRAEPQGVQATKALLNASIAHHIEGNAARVVKLSADLFASEVAQRTTERFRAPGFARGDERAAP